MKSNPLGLIDALRTHTEDREVEHGLFLNTFLLLQLFCSFWLLQGREGVNEWQVNKQRLVLFIVFSWLWNAFCNSSWPDVSPLRSTFMCSLVCDGLPHTFLCQRWAFLWVAFSDLPSLFLSSPSFWLEGRSCHSVVSSLRQVGFRQLLPGYLSPGCPFGLGIHVLLPCPVVEVQCD